MTEQGLQKKIIDYLKGRGCFVINVTSASPVGVCDLVACSPELGFLAVEVKLPSGKVSKIQQYRIDQIKKASGTAIVARSLQDVKEIFSKV